MSICEDVATANVSTNSNNQPQKPQLKVRKNQGTHLIKYLIDAHILNYFARNSSAALQMCILAALKKLNATISTMSAITRCSTVWVGIAARQWQSPQNHCFATLMAA